MFTKYHLTVNKIFDHLARPRLAFSNLRVSAYKICGYAGIGLALLLNIVLFAHQSLSFYILAALAANMLLTFYVLALATKVVVGEETLIYYHHEIAILLTSALLLWLLDRPVLVYLDQVVLAVGMFLVCGRIGCLMVGCCHGRPHPWGVRYHREHAAEGFESCLVGVRLFPVQALEALWVGAVVLGGSVLVVKNYPPGEALALYTMVYGIGRFCFEFVRGDSKRPHWLGFSEAQWTTVILMMLTLAAEVGGLLTWHAWHAALAAATLAIMIAVAGFRRARGHTMPALRHPGHVIELAEIIDLLSDHRVNETQEETFSIPVGCTSNGLRISSGRLVDSASGICHYALSQKDDQMTEKTAARLAAMIQQLRHPLDTLEIMPGKPGIYHLLFQGHK
ncbi:hypothetical protein D1AOALGA4SA_7259 [Olavius algarvensis Delta 1 endosymbiont]|nr:hypothetical protein D1AOALGA4SA_7259 [Olavius algarvensis Delta 1 endosymbiont]